MCWLREEAWTWPNSRVRTKNSLSNCFKFVFHFSQSAHPSSFASAVRSLQVISSPAAVPSWLPSRNVGPAWRTLSGVTAETYTLASDYGLKVTVTPTHIGSGCMVVQTSYTPPPHPPPHPPPPPPPADSCAPLHSFPRWLLSESLGLNTNTTQHNWGMLISLTAKQTSTKSVKSLESMWHKTSFKQSGTPQWDLNYKILLNIKKERREKKKYFFVEISLWFYRLSGPFPSQFDQDVHLCSP